MGRAMFSKSFIQFSVDGWSCVHCLLFTWDQTMVEVMETMVTSFKRSHACTATLSAPSPAAGHPWPTPPPETPGHFQASLCQSLWAHCSFFLGPGAHKVCLSPLRISWRYVVWLWMWFCSSYHLLGLLLCSWTLGYLLTVGALYKKESLFIF